MAGVGQLGGNVGIPDQTQKNVVDVDASLAQVVLLILMLRISSTTANVRPADFGRIGQ